MKPAFQKTAMGKAPMIVRHGLILPHRWYQGNKIYKCKKVHIYLDELKSFQEKESGESLIRISTDNANYDIAMSFDSFVYLKQTAEAEQCSVDFRDFEGLELHEDVDMVQFNPKQGFAPRRKATMNR